LSNEFPSIYEQGHRMSKRLARWALGCAIAVAGAWVSTPLFESAGPAKAQAAAPRENEREQLAQAQQAEREAVAQAQQLAAVEELKAQAFKALRAGQFDRSSELLGKAAAGANDPTLSQMAAWTKGFESQRQTFAAERRKQFDKAVDDVKKLLDHKKREY